MRDWLKISKVSSSVILYGTKKKGKKASELPLEKFYLPHATATCACIRIRVGAEGPDWKNQYFCTYVTCKYIHIHICHTQ